MVELKLKTMNRNQVMKRANRMVWNVYLRRTLLMAMSGISLLGMYNLGSFVYNL